MKWFARLLFALSALVALTLSGRAGDVSSADQATIRSIVQGQLDAFRRDDDTGAYSYASPAIRSLYPTVDSFMNMVKRGFPQVYRPQSVTFGMLGDSPTGPKQRVLLTGPDGRHWIAEYTLQRQPDGSWKINGCKLLEDTGETI